MTQITSRLCLNLALAAGMLLIAGCLFEGLESEHRPDPEDAEWQLGESARDLLAEAAAGIKGPVLDRRMHLLEFDPDETDAVPKLGMLFPNSRGLFHPASWFRGASILDAARVNDRDQAQVQYISRLLRLIRALPYQSRHYLLALDKPYAPDGTPTEGDSGHFVSNEAVHELAQRYPEHFIPVISVHPYREDAVQALEAWSQRGAKTVRWVPAVQLIDPADEANDAYYAALKRLDMTLLVEAGKAREVAHSRPELANPLRLRRVLDGGIEVIVSQVSATQSFADLEAADKSEAAGLQLFLRLIDDPKYGALLYGDISAQAYGDRAEQTLLKMLQTPRLFQHLVYGSDYPLPALDAAKQLEMLVTEGFISKQQAEALKEIHRFNPLAFDFALKRSLRLPHTQLGFVDAAFGAKRGLNEAQAAAQP